MTLKFTLSALRMYASYVGMKGKKSMGRTGLLHTKRNVTILRVESHMQSMR